MKKLLMFLLLGIFLISFASAAEFDNVVSNYDEETRTVTIKNLYGAGEIIGEARLNTPLNVVVPVGYQKVAEFDLWAYQDYSDALKQLTFLDMKNGKIKINREFDLRWKDYENYEVIDYITVCNDSLINNTEATNVCWQEENGSHIESREIWRKISPADLKKNERLTIGVFTDVQEGDFVDWIPMIYGVEIEQWATWTADLNVDLYSVWKLDETTGTTAYDELGVNNLSNLGTAAINQTIAKDGTSYYYDGGDRLYKADIGTEFGGTGSFTYSGWFRPDASQGSGTNTGYIFQLGDAVNPSRGLHFYDSTNSIRYRDASGGLASSANSVWTSATWYHVAMVYNGSGMNIFLDGVSIVNDTDSGSIATNPNLYVGWSDANYLFSGYVDEIYMWNRTLSQEEIETLADDTFYSEITAENPSVILNSPVDNYNSTIPSITFNVTVTDPVKVDNVTLYIDGIANETNSSGINGTYIFTKSVSFGTHNWSILAYNNQSLSNQSETRDFNYTDSPPSVVLISPADTANLTSATVQFQTTVTDNIGVSSVSLYLDGSLNETNSSGVNGSYTFTKVVSEGDHNWSIRANDTVGLINQSEIRTFNYTATVITIDLLSPPDASSYKTPLVNMSCKASVDGGVTQLNLTIDGTTNETITNSTPNENLTLEKLINFSEGNYTWSCSAQNGDTTSTSSNRTFEVLYSNPTITLNSPINYANLTSTTVFLNYTVTDSNGIYVVYTYIDGALETVDYSGVNGSYYEAFGNLTEGLHNWSINATSILDKTTVSETQYFNIILPAPNITITAPANNSVFLDNNVSFIFTATDANGIANVSLYADGVLNQTNYSGVNGSYQFDQNFSGGFHNWSIKAASITGTTTDSPLRIFSIHATGPTVTISEPSGVIDILHDSDILNLTYNVSETGYNQSHFDTCWYDYPTDNNLVTSDFASNTYWNFVNGTMSGSAGLNTIRTGLLLPSGDYEFNVNFATNNLGISDFKPEYPDCNTESYSSLRAIYSTSTVGYYACIKNDDGFKYLIKHNSYNVTTPASSIFETYEYSKIINCSESQTNFTYFASYDNITVFANDTFGLVGNSISHWFPKITFYNISYNSQTYETAEETFTSYIDTNLTGYDSFTAILDYNGTSNFTATQTTVGDLVKIDATGDIPPINGGLSNRSFNWLFVLSNLTTTDIYESDSYYQNTSTILLQNCLVNETPYIIINTKDITTGFPDLNATLKTTWSVRIQGSDADPTNFSFEDLTETNNTWAFCIEPDTNNYTVSVDIEVDATDYAKNFYYITDSNYTSGETSNLTLYLLNDSLATVTTLKVRSKYQQPIERALIYIQLYDIGTDTYTTYGMAKTNQNGEDIVFLNWYDSLYKFVIVEDGTTIISTDPYKVGESPQIFQKNDSTTYDFDKFRDFEYNLYFNNATGNFILTYVKPSGLVEEGCLRVLRRDSTGDEQICLTCSESASATLFCNINSYGNGTFIATFYATGSLAVIDWITTDVGIGISERIFNNLDQNDSLFYTILTALMVVGLFMVNIVLGIVGILAGLLLASALGYTLISYTTFLTIAIVGGVIIWLIRR